MLEVAACGRIATGVVYLAVGEAAFGTRAAVVGLVFFDRYVFAGDVGVLHDFGAADILVVVTKAGSDRLGNLRVRAFVKGVVALVFINCGVRSLDVARHKLVVGVEVSHGRRGHARVRVVRARAAARVIRLARHERLAVGGLHPLLSICVNHNLARVARANIPEVKVGRVILGRNLDLECLVRTPVAAAHGLGDGVGIRMARVGVVLVVEGVLRRGGI